MNSINLKAIASYFDNTVRTHGATPRGVDWSGEQAQIIRFQQILRVLEHAEPGASLADIGCGYGQLLESIRPELKINYAGYDVSPAMIEQAIAHHHHRPNSKFRLIESLRDIEPCDYAVASGIFNMKLSLEQAEWNQYIFDALDQFHRIAQHGFSFNMLTIYSDSEKMRSDLFYADPCKIFDHCKRNYSRNVALLHDYALYDFTILVRKDA
jgi:SAM-dependent methyltransferase